MCVLREIYFANLSGAPYSVFESTIRYLGAMLSAYELSGEKYPALIKQAETLADKLSAAWSKGNVIPYGEVDVNTSTPTIQTVSYSETFLKRLLNRSQSNIAEAGTVSVTRPTCQAIYLYLYRPLIAHTRVVSARVSRFAP